MAKIALYNSMLAPNGVMARTTGQSGGISSTVLAKQIMGDGATYDEFLRQRGKHCINHTNPIQPH
jgi:hypothetical protein